jgi:hypothetical protein
MTSIASHQPGMPTRGSEISGYMNSRSAGARRHVSSEVELGLFIAFLAIVFAVIIAVPWYGTTGGREDKRYLL